MKRFFCALPCCLAIMFTPLLHGQENIAAEVEKSLTGGKYSSSYAVKFSFSREELIGDMLAGLRSDPKEESSIPFHEWYSPKVRKEYGSWGPPVRHYPQPEGIHKRAVKWKQERVIATGLRFLGYDYQHHHIPDWNPPEKWPWKDVGAGHNGKGVDCSNFTAFVYNLALGIKFTSDVKLQAELTHVKVHGQEKELKIERIERPKTYEDFVRELRTGDLLFLARQNGEAFHVVIWVGAIGQSPDNMPLVLDSTGTKHVDAGGISIPQGIHLRPFTRKSNYFQRTSHILRIIN